MGRLWERLKAWPVEPHWLEACGRRHKVMRIKFRAVQIKLTYVPAGSVGVSLELDVWAGRRYGYVSIGKRYSGHVWLRSGRL